MLSVVNSIQYYFAVRSRRREMKSIFHAKRSYDTNCHEIWAYCRQFFPLQFVRCLFVATICWMDELSAVFYLPLSLSENMFNGCENKSPEMAWLIYIIWQNQISACFPLPTESQRCNIGAGRQFPVLPIHPMG